MPVIKKNESKQKQLKGFKKYKIYIRRRERIRRLSNDYFVETVLWPE